MRLGEFIVQIIELITSRNLHVVIERDLLLPQLLSKQFIHTDHSHKILRHFKLVPPIM